MVLLGNNHLAASGVCALVRLIGDRPRKLAALRVVVRVDRAGCKGFRSLFAADGAGFEVHRLFGAGHGGFQILLVGLFRREGMVRQLFAAGVTIMIVVRVGALAQNLTTDVALVVLVLVCASFLFNMAGVSGADALMRLVVVGCPFAVVMPRRRNHVTGKQNRVAALAIGIARVAVFGAGSVLLIPKLRAADMVCQVLLTCRRCAVFAGLGGYTGRILPFMCRKLSIFLLAAFADSLCRAGRFAAEHMVRNSRSFFSSVSSSSHGCAINPRMMPAEPMSMS